MQVEQVTKDEQREQIVGHLTHTVTLLSKYPSIGMHLEVFRSKTLKSMAELQARQVEVLRQVKQSYGQGEQLSPFTNYLKRQEHPLLDSDCP